MNPLCEPLLQQLLALVPSDDKEAAHRDVIVEHVRTCEWPFDRGNASAHLTASALIVDASGEKVLLGLHRKLGRWLQLGGHGEPCEVTGEAVAMREALEESGISGLYLHPGAARPLDVDVHVIPEHKGVSAHRHLDLRYVVVAPEGQEASVCEQEHRELRWFTWQELEALELDGALCRAYVKCARLMQSSPSEGPIPYVTAGDR